MIDSHCHLDMREFDKDREEVVAAAKKAGVKMIIDPAADFKSNDRIAGISEQYRGYVMPCAGLDPVSCLKEGGIDKLGKYVDGAIAVGEVGLDYYWSKEKEKQIRNFSHFIKLAKEHGKPIVVHARDSMSDALDMLEKGGLEKVILHCFSGTLPDLQRAEELGYYISFATNICYRDSKSLIKEVSLSNILVETDAPWLHPERRGRNEPKNVIKALECIASTRGMPVSELEKMTERNTKKAFGL